MSSLQNNVSYQHDHIAVVATKETLKAKSAFAPLVNVIKSAEIVTMLEGQSK